MKDEKTDTKSKEEVKKDVKADASEKTMEQREAASAMPGRDVLHQRYQEFVENEKKEAEQQKKDASKDSVKEEKKEEKQEEKKEEKPEKDSTAPVAEKTDAGVSPDKDTTEKTGKKPGWTDMVPHAALHEERLRRKEAEAELRKMKEEYENTLEEIKIIKSEDPASGGELESDVKVKRLEATVAKLEKHLFQRTQAEQAEIMKRHQFELSQKLDVTERELETEGYKGFGFFKSQVAEELRSLVDKDEANKHLDNPDGWKKIYKDIVYPRVQGMFAQKVREEKKKEKEMLKEAASLAATPGSAPATFPKKEQTPEEAYMEERRKLSASSY